MSAYRVLEGGKLKEGDHVKDGGVEEKKNIKISVKGIGFEVCIDVT